MNQPAKKDFIDKAIDLITGDSSPKTQLQQVIVAQMTSASFENQMIASELSGDLTAGLRGLASADRVTEVLEAGIADNIKTPFGAAVFRKVQNTGDFSGLAESMQLRNVQKVAKNAGIGLDGVKVKIVRDPELIGKGLYGHADANTIELYPDAFTNTEELVKTLGHERMHVYQTRTFGIPDSTMLGKFENAAYGSEGMWWNYYLRQGK